MRIYNETVSYSFWGFVYVCTKTTAGCFELILEAAPYKTVAVPSLIPHLTKNPSKKSKTCWALQGK